MTVVSAYAETAILRLGALTGFFRQASLKLARVPTPGRARLRTVRARCHPTRYGQDSAQLRILREVTLVRCVSIVEAYAMDLGEDELYRRLARPAVRPKAQPLVQYLLEHRWEPIVRSGGWEQLLDVWKDGIALNPREFPDWQELDVLRATRHSIVHRLGEFTAQYRKKAQGKLKALGLEPATATGLIPLSDVDVHAGLALGRQFVLWLDDELAVRAPAIR